jgi:hypothetical protein
MLDHEALRNGRYRFLCRDFAMSMELAGSTVAGGANHASGR